MTTDVLHQLEELHAIFTDRHFVYTSGKHGSAYINLDALFPNTAAVAEICDLLIAPFVGEIDTVAAPATGGIVLAVLASRAFHARGETAVKAVWADKASTGFAFERAGFVDNVTGRRVLVVEDLLNTGGSVEQVCRLVEHHGGRLVGASVVCNRGASTATSLGVSRLEALTELRLDAFDAEDCPLCAQARPIVEDLSHGGTFKARHPDYAGGYVKLQA